MDTAAEIAAAELAAGMTAIIPPAPGVTHALSANGHWDYELNEDLSWTIWDRRTDKAYGYDTSPNSARRRTFAHDHPLYGPHRAPARARYTIL